MVFNERRAVSQSRGQRWYQALLGYIPYFNICSPPGPSLFVTCALVSRSFCFRSQRTGNDLGHDQHVNSPFNYWTCVRCSGVIIVRYSGVSKVPSSLLILGSWCHSSCLSSSSIMSCDGPLKPHLFLSCFTRVCNCSGLGIP